ncbi:MAG: hypothetical protein HYX74_12395 [Acidobacteria bacterium]|nr:hypothetical protein [Acidobacteriota bacterium]
MSRTGLLLIVICLIVLLAILGSHSLITYALEGIPGSGSVSGMVTAPKPFKAAQVYLRTLDKKMLYVVFIVGGRYQAINLMPGTYEVWVEKRGFKSDVQKAQIKAGSSLKLDLALKEGETQAITLGGAVRENVELVSYDQLYPPGPGRDLVERTCMVCHLQNFLPARHMTTDQWDAAIGLMMDATFTTGRSPDAYGAQIQAGSSVGVLNAAQRKTVAEYLGRYFGPGSPNRALKVNMDYPLDEQALSRAMFIEYFLPVDGPYKDRKAQDPKIDNEGNVWYTNYGIPNTVGKLDPRTGQFTDYPLPDPKSHPHGITIDSKGYVFWAESAGGHLGRLDPKTGKMDRFSHTVPGAHMNTPVLDSHENVWFTLILGNKIGKWDRKTEKVTVWEAPSANSFPYGIVRSSDDKLWFAGYHSGKVARFDPVTEKFTEFPARSQPSLIRRPGVDSKGTIWFGVWNRGKLDRLDPSTGEIAEYDLLPHTEPYDVFPDPNGQVWISDGGLGGSLIRFDPQTKKSTFYPTPRRTDMPKLDITRDGAIWYTTRSNPQMAIGVLYPDVSKMTSYAATRWK